MVDTPKGKGPPTATGFTFQTGNGTESEYGKVGNTQYRMKRSTEGKLPGGKPERVSTKEAS
ncbi:hypothetical protein, partial [Streptomyces sp. ODS05-4]|uniref:hypothetical protein n=1 Tax=Streptomyces sp. ODS05-4 TaxID=2944939 RepID=UPI0021095C5D